MYGELLAQFISKTSEWSEFKQGREVFQSASELFKEVFQIDSGFFIYKKRLPSLSEPFKIYSPWGIYEHSTDFLQTLLDENKPLLDHFVESRSDKWLDIKESPIELEAKIHKFGIWKLYSQGQIVGLLVLIFSQPKTYIDETMISTCAKQISLILDMMLAWRTADQLSRYDSLTGVFNRKGLLDQYQSLVSNAEINGTKIMIGVLDIDNFKQINDYYGHLEGDRTLIDVADTLKTNIRSTDLVGRFGGDEFVLVMETQHDNHEILEHRITELFPQSKGYCISVGFAVWTIDGAAWDECYSIADKRLYKNKSTRKLGMVSRLE